MGNRYEELDELMEWFEKARKYALENAEYFANLKPERVVYSTPSDFILGITCPSLILDIAYSKSFIRGRKLKHCGDRTEYMSYEYDSQGKLIRIYNADGVFTRFSCIFELGGYSWAVPVYKYKGSYKEYPKAEMTKHDDSGRILVYATFDTAQIWLEKYIYPENDPFTASCQHWNYIPKLAYSDKEKAVFETGSPAQLWIYKLDLRDPKKATGKLTECYKRDVSAYRQKPQVLPPPQLHIKYEE